MHKKQEERKKRILPKASREMLIEVVDAWRDELDYTDKVLAKCLPFVPNVLAVEITALLSRPFVRSFYYGKKKKD